MEDKEIEKFIPQEYWNIFVELLKNKEIFKYCCILTLFFGATPIINPVNTMIIMLVTLE